MLNFYFPAIFTFFKTMYNKLKNNAKKEKYAGPEGYTLNNKQNTVNR